MATRIPRTPERSPRRVSVRALLVRLPKLAHTLPRVDLRLRETPVERWAVEDVALLIKRDDLSAPTLGGNKVRALELLLARLGRNQTLLTVGASGSTHALAVAQYGARLDAQTEVITWPQLTHDVSRATTRRLEGIAHVTVARSPLDAYLRAGFRRLRGKYRWIPAGGSVPLGALGHVSAALELVEQLERESIPLPHTLVVPLGSGGTVAGLLVGFALAGVTTRIVGVRVVPRVVANRWRVLRLARGTRTLLAKLSGENIPPLDDARLEIDDGWYGGAYARETDAARDAARALARSGGPTLDATYSAKAFASALARARAAPDGGVLFWLTFDARWLGDAHVAPRVLRPPR